MLKAFDVWLFLPALFLSVLGLLVIFSVSPGDLRDQLVSLGIALAIFLLILLIDPYIIQGFSPILYIFCLVLLLATYVFGAVSRGSVRWLDFGLFRFQASEICKPLLAVSLASFAARFDLTKIKDFFLFSLFFIFPFLLVFRQPDLGSALVIASIWGGIVLAKKTSAKIVLSLIILILILMPLFFRGLKPYQKERLSTFLNPSADPLGASYNQVQAVITVGSGKFWGKGLGGGSQSHLKFLPENQTDFIFATFAEEFGFVGSLLLFGLYGVLFIRLLQVAKNPKNEFSFLSILAIFSFIFFQTVIHIGMNIGILPVTGITLPFISAGGSSLLSTWLSLGFAMAAAKERNRKTVFHLT